jgi:hypothetical protein
MKQILKALGLQLRCSQFLARLQNNGGLIVTIKVVSAVAFAVCSGEACRTLEWGPFSSYVVEGHYFFLLQMVTSFVYYFNSKLQLGCGLFTISNLLYMRAAP